MQILRFSFFLGGGGYLHQTLWGGHFGKCFQGGIHKTTQYGRGADKKWNGPITNSNQCTAYLDRSKTMTAAILLTKYCFALLITIIYNLLLY